MSADKAAPRFPAWGHDQDWAWRLSSLEPLRIASEVHLRAGRLFDVHVLDADLDLFEVVGAHELGRAGILGWRPGFKGKYFRIAPVFQLKRKCSLEEAKKYVLDFISSHLSVYDSGVNFEELSLAVTSASSAEELFHALTE